MNEKDLMNAITDIDDDLIVFEEKRKKPFKHSWKAIIAAVLVMAFSVTAYAVGNITTSQKTKVYDASNLWHLYYDIEGEGEVEFYEMSVEYKLEPQKVSKEFYNDCVAALNCEYESVQAFYNDYENKEFILPEGEELWASFDFCFDGEKSSYTVEELEKYIGRDFCLSEELREGINEIANNRKAGKTALYQSSICVTGKRVSEEEGRFVPLCATINFIADYDDKGNFIYTTVFICLSEEKTTATSVWNSYEKEGKWTEKIMETDSGREVYFLHNNPKKGYRSTARACWTENGIGYEAYTAMAFDWENKHEGVKYLMPYIENLE